MAEEGEEVTVLSQTRGEWLRTQRQARGWNVPEMRHQLREAATEAGDKIPSNNCLSVMIHRWENDRSGISERYRLHYCRAFQIPPGSFGKPTIGSVLRGNGADTDGIGAIVTRLFPEAPAAFPLRVTLGQELRTAVEHLRDPANGDELCFLLGYVTAMMITAGQGSQTNLGPG